MWKAQYFACTSWWNLSNISVTNNEGHRYDLWETANVSCCTLQYLILVVGQTSHSLTSIKIIVCKNGFCFSSDWEYLL